MKKKLEAELISIAHRILKLKNKSELHQLHQEARNLYEKLSILRFVEDNFADAKPTIGRAEIDDKIEAAFEVKEQKPEVVSQTIIEAEEKKIGSTIVAEHEKEIQVTNPEREDEEGADQKHDIGVVDQEEPIAEVTEEAVAEIITENETSEIPEKDSPIVASDHDFKPSFELSFDTKDEEIEAQIQEEIKNGSPQITFDDLLGPNYIDPVFVKPEDLEKEKSAEASNVIPIGRSYNDSAQVISINKDQATSINDRMAKGIIIGLNDRIAFMNHLFANSSEDYNRVLSQLMTFDSFDEAKNFIDTMVKPDYNNWEGKDEYAERFMEIIEKRFS